MSNPSVHFSSCTLSHHQDATDFIVRFAHPAAFRFLISVVDFKQKKNRIHLIHYFLIPMLIYHGLKFGGNITSWRRNFVTVCSWRIQTSWHRKSFRDKTECYYLSQIFFVTNIFDVTKSTWHLCPVSFVTLVLSRSCLSRSEKKLSRSKNSSRTKHSSRTDLSRISVVSNQ